MPFNFISWTIMLTITTKTTRSICTMVHLTISWTIFCLRSTRGHLPLLEIQKKSPKSPNSSFSRGSQHRHRYWWRYWSNLERSRCTWWASSSWQLGNWNPTQALQSHKNYWKTKWKCLLLTHKWYKFRAQIHGRNYGVKKNT